MRRAGARFLVALIGVTSAFSLPAAQTPRGGAPDAAWPQFRGNARLTGVATAAPAPPLTVRWTYEAGEAIESSPAIRDGRVYVGVATGDLLALDLETGKLQWKYATGGSIGESSPTVGDQAVFIGDLTGTVHAVKVRDGQRLWTFKTGGEVKSSPVLVGDTLLIGSYDTHFYSLGARPG